MHDNKTWRDRLQLEPKLQLEYQFDRIDTPRIPQELDVHAHLLNGNFVLNDRPDCFQTVTRFARRTDGDAYYSSIENRNIIEARKYLSQNSFAQPRFVGGKT
jgi:hypothetical protein